MGSQPLAIEYRDIVIYNNSSSQEVLQCVKALLYPIYGKYLFKMSQNELPYTSDSTLRFFLLYCSCWLLVIIFVNFYSLYSILRGQFGLGFITYSPILLPIIFFLILAVSLVKKQLNGQNQFQISWIFAGGALAFTALFIPDPDFAVKRIHVSEYILLSLLVRFTLCNRLSGTSLLLFSALVTAVFGIHDEFLQGIHSSRTFGLRDIAVNTVAALAGCFLWHGLALFAGKKKMKGPDKKQIFPTGGYLLWLSLSVFLLILPMPAYRFAAIPIWICLPLAASTVYWCSFFINHDSELSPGINVLSYTAIALLIYPVIINIFHIPFH